MLHFRGGLIRAMVRAGHDLHLLVPAGEGVLGHFDEESAALSSLGAQVHTYPLRRASISPIHDLVTLWHVFRKIGIVEPDVLLAYMMKPVVYGMLSALILRVGKRYALLDGLGFAFTENGRANNAVAARVTRLLLALALRAAQRVLLLNSDDRNDLIRHGVLAPNKPFSIIAGTGLDLEHFDGPMADVNSRRFVMISRLLRDKGVREFAEAARLVKQRRPDATFVLIGDVDMAPGAISRDEVAGWTWLQYVGKIGDVRPFLQDCLAYVLPSYREGRPRTVMEAMAMRRACIVTDVPGCRECIEHEATGLIVPPQNPETLKDAMMRYLEQPQLAIVHGIEARKRAECEYDLEAVNLSVLKALSIPAY